MEEEIEKAVLRAVEKMRDNLSEPLTIDDIARAAIFSKFHFSRVFQRVTGLSPGRFLSAVRIQEAKRLLTATDLAVTEISHRVGYSSVGTFSTRFKSSVGVSPTTYRQLGRVTPPVPGDARRSDHSTRTVTIRGDIWSPMEDRPVFAGLFPGRILQGIPVSCTVLTKPGPYVLEDVPPGSWHLMAQSVAAGREDAIDHPHGTDQAVCVGFHGPIVVRPDSRTRRANVRLRPARPLDPPVLLALGDLRAAALEPGERLHAT